MTKFIDANIFIGRWVNPDIKEFVDTLNRGKHCTSVLVLIEVYHKLTRKKVDTVFDYLRGIMGSIPVYDITQNDFFNALKDTSDLHINDKVHIEVMKRNNVATIISFDKDFDRIKTIERVEV